MLRTSIDPGKVMEYAMSLRCKPGDIAIVIHDFPSCKDNLLHVVRVTGSPRYDHLSHQFKWLIDPLSKPNWCLNTSAENAEARVLDRVDCFYEQIEHPDDWLKPIQRTHFYSLSEIIEHDRQAKEAERQVNLRESTRGLLP
jgi:hypothetical protein